MFGEEYMYCEVSCGKICLLDTRGLCSLCAVSRSRVPHRARAAVEIVHPRAAKSVSKYSKGVAELVKYLFLYLAMRGTQARIAARNARHTLNLRHALALEDKKSKAG